MNTGVAGADQMSQPPQSYELRSPPPGGSDASAAAGYPRSSGALAAEATPARTMARAATAATGAAMRGSTVAGGDGRRDGIRNASASHARAWGACEARYGAAAIARNGMCRSAVSD